jgi:hypothetical protein
VATLPAEHARAAGLAANRRGDFEQASGILKAAAASSVASAAGRSMPVFSPRFSPSSASG